MSDLTLNAAIRDLVRAIALDRAYAMSNLACSTCGLPASGYADLGAKHWCDKHKPDSLGSHDGEFPNAAGIRRLMKVAGQ